MTLISFFGIYASIHAYLLRWTCDDAFISFRYARNAAQGLGLVFNAGERVEGFTNFLWTAFLIPVIGLGANPVHWSWLLSILCMVGLFAFLGHRQYQQENQRHWPLLLAGLLSATMHFLVFATSGLETMAFSASAFIGLYFSLGGDRIGAQNEQVNGYSKDEGSLAIGLSLLVITCLLRPDGFIFFSVAWVSGCLRIFRRKAPLAVGDCTALIASLAVLALYEIARYQYYGAWLPNTFYAKSAYSSYAHQGLTYLALFYKGYWFWPLLGLALIIPQKNRLPTAWVPMLLTAVLWHIYVLWVGGDFMFGRFLVPVLPILGFLIATSIDARLPAKPRPLLFAPLILLLWFACAFFRYDPYARPLAAGEIPQISGIVDERLFYPRDTMQELSRLAASYRPVVRSSEVRLA
ncbi:MAG: hypothetical protein KDK37_18890, partial [Leptospiraceae bacterium]|nr:hypothetical protein [Leptospiraceae bacterium]